MCYFESMKIDSDNALTKFSKKGKQINIIKSDHNLLICKFNINPSKFKPPNDNKRIQQFNFSDPKG